MKFSCFIYSFSLIIICNTFEFCTDICMWPCAYYEKGKNSAKSDVKVPIACIHFIETFKGSTV